MKEEASTCAFKEESDFKGWRGQRWESLGVKFGDLRVNVVPQVGSTYV